MSDELPNSYLQQTDVLLYGLHCVLFVICIFTIARNYDRVGAGPRRHFRWFLFAAAIAMFALSTADTAITFHSMRHDILHTLGKGGFHKFVRMGFNKGPIYVANKYVSLVLAACIITHFLTPVLLQNSSS